MGVEYLSTGQIITGAPGSSTDNAIVRWDGTGGASLQNSGVTIDDSNNVIIAGNLTVSGTTSTINSTTTTYVDPIIHLQTASGGGALAGDSDKDVGIAMQYHTGSAAKTAFLGIDDSDYKLMFIPEVDSITSEVVAGTVGTIKANLEGNADTATALAGTLTTLQVDYINLNASTITITDSTDTGDLATLAVTTHGATTLTTVDDNATAAHLVLDVDGNIEFDSAAGIFIFEDGGTEVLRITESGTGDVTIKLETDGKDLIFTDNADAVNMTILDAAVGINVPGEVQTTGIAFTDGDNAMTIADGGGVTFPISIDITGSTGIILENDETITNSTNGEVAINGTVVVGTGGAAGTLKSSGNFDLTLATGNSTTGTITITDGANGDITLAPNGTGNSVLASATSTDIILDGNKSVTPGDGAVIHVDAHTITDSATAQDATTAKFTHVNIEAPTLAASNTGVTTSDAATFYISGTVAAGTNQTLTRPWAMWVDAGNARFDGSIYSGTTEAINSSGLVQVANQSAITGVSTITSGTWEATDVAVLHGGTGSSSASGARSNLGAQASLTFGISDDNAVEIDGADIADNEYARFTANGLESRTAAEVAEDIEGSIDAVGTLAAGAISSGFGNIDIGSSTFDTTGAVSTGNLSPAGDVAVADGKVIKLGGSRPADDEPATGGASGNNTGYGIVVLFDAGAAVAIGDAVSIDTTGRVIKTVADATGTLSGPCIGVATTAAGSADDDVYVMTHGVFRHDDWNFGTKGQAVYIEEADPGDLSLTAPNDDGDYAQRVGVAITDDVLLVMPSIDVIEHTGE